MLCYGFHSECDSSNSVSNCYVFKSRLQEYAQKKGLPTPVYETIKEGPSHEPSFRSTVMVNDVRYDSLPGFFNRKAAEQSAAEVALVELAKSDELNQSISQPVHETGLCKNLLQEYAQKMNYAIPVYLCQKDETPGRGALFKCTVEIGGIHYIGASAKTKKEAEIKAARTALLAIKSSASKSSHKQNVSHQLTVIPLRKRVAESTPVLEEVSHIPKAKKTRFKKKLLKKKLSRDKINHNQGNTEIIRDRQSGLDLDQTDASLVQGTCHGASPSLPMKNLDNDGSVLPMLSERETTDVNGSLMHHIPGDFEKELSVASNVNGSNDGMPSSAPAECNGDANEGSGIAPTQIDASSTTPASFGTEQ